MSIDQHTAREFLEDERRRLEQALASVTSDLVEERAGTGDELADYDQHPAERGTEVSDTARDLGLRADFAGRLRENAAAERRLDDGRYGVCETCSRPISDDRLRAMPSARHCVEHELVEVGP